MFHQLSMHLKSRQKYSAVCHIFNSLLGVWGYPDETLSLVKTDIIAVIYRVRTGPGKSRNVIMATAPGKFWKFV